MNRPLSHLVAVPAARALPAGAPLRDRVQAAVDGVAWPQLSWRELVRELAAVGRVDAVLGRLAEGHVDALRTLGQAGRAPVPGALYGVWASRSRGGGLQAVAAGNGWQLSGTVPFASGVGLVDRALVTATGPDGQLLLDVPVDDWEVLDDGWYTSAMADSASLTLCPAATPVTRDAQVGPLGFYLDRPLFLPGGVGVAAVWWGAAARVLDLTLESLGRGPELAQVSAVQLGRMRAELTAAGAALHAAADRLDGVLAPDDAGPAALQQLSTETRTVVADAAHRLLDHARQLAGPAGLARDRHWGPAIADLDLYLRQRHQLRDAEAMGRDAAGPAAPPAVPLTGPDLVVAVPAHDEELLVAACLRSVVAAVEHAVSSGVVRRPVVVLAAHRCTDATAGVAGEILGGSAIPHLVVADVQPGPVGAVRARSLRMLETVLPPDDSAWVMTTDADSTVPVDWVTSALALAAAGADAVTGMVEIVDWEAGPTARARYAALLQAGMTPDGHTHVWAANLAVSWLWYRRVGGFRPVAHGEETDLVDRLRSEGARVVPSLQPVVRTSGRMPGRAAHGLGALLSQVSATSDGLALDGAAS